MKAGDLPRGIWKRGEWHNTAIALNPSMEEHSRKPLLHKQTRDMAVVGMSLVVLPVLGLMFLCGLVYHTALAHSVASVLSKSHTFQLFMEPLRCWYLLPLIMGFLIRSLFKLPPTHLIVSTAGLMADRRECLCSGTILDISWKDLERIYLPASARKRAKNIVCFKTKEGKVYELKLADLLDANARERLMSALWAWAPHVECDDEIYELLQPTVQTTFTELWLNALAAPPERERLSPLVPGSKLHSGEYTIDGAVGMGGQGTAYGATRKKNGTQERVVIKEYVLPVHVTRAAKTRSLESMEHEARLLGQLDHPQVVKLLDFFVEDHRGYLVFELIEGNNLRSIVESEGRLDEEQVRLLALQMCDILSYLHDRTPSVVHRDFTPDNLILTPGGQLKLIDFNVAQESGHTATATVVGKHAYLPPEQFRGKPTPQSDLYAMGATLQFLLTGIEPEPLSVAHPQETASVSADLDRFVAKLTELELSDRYQSAAEAKSDLEGVRVDLKKNEAVSDPVVQ